MDHHHSHYANQFEVFWVHAYGFCEMELFVGEVEEQALDLGR